MPSCFLYNQLQYIDFLLHLLLEEYLRKVLVDFSVLDPYKAGAAVAV